MLNRMWLHKYWFYLLIGCFILIFGWQYTKINIMRDPCIPAWDDFSINTDQSEVYPETPVPPSGKWKKSYSMDLKYGIILAVRNIGDDHYEFWIQNSDYPMVSKKTISVYVAKPNSKRGMVLTPIRTFEIDGAVEEIRFVNADAWIIKSKSFFDGELFSKKFFSGKISEGSDQIAFNKIEFYGEDGNKITIAKPMHALTEVVWFISPDNYIYEYSLKSQKIVPLLQLEGMNVTDAVVDLNESMYLYIASKKSPSDGEWDELYKYNLISGTLTNIPVEIEFDRYTKRLFLDGSGRVWLGSFGYMDVDGVWTQLVRTPLFYQARSEAVSDRIYHWQPPNLVFEYPKDKFWFTNSGGGTFSLDLQKKTWCWVSTSSQLAQANNNSLWILFNHDLYKFTDK